MFMKVVVMNTIKMTKLYAVVLFPPDETVSIVPQSWLLRDTDNTDLCLWPGPNVRSLSKVIESCTPPPQPNDWRKYRVIVKREDIEGYAAALVIENNVRDNKEENLSEEPTMPPKRPRMKPTKFSADSEGSEADNESNCSPLLREKSSKIVRKALSPLTPEILVSNFPTPPAKTPETTSESVTSNARTHGSEQTVSKVVKKLSYDKRHPVDSNCRVLKDATQTTKSPKNPTPVKESILDDASSSVVNNNSQTIQSKNGRTLKGKSNSSHVSSSVVNKSLQTTQSESDLTFQELSNPKGSSSSSSSSVINVTPQTSKFTRGSAASEKSELAKFQDTWSGWDDDQRIYYMAETLYIVRRSMPTLLASSLSGGSGSSAKVVTASFKKDPLMSCFPIKNDTDLATAEGNLKIKGFKDKLTFALLTKKSEDLKETAREMCSFLFTDEFGKNYSMIGQRNKMSFVELPIVALLLSVLKDAFNPQKNVVNHTDKEIRNAITAWLTFCKSRIEKRAKAAAEKMRKKQVAAIPESEDEDEAEAETEQNL